MAGSAGLAGVATGSAAEAAEAGAVPNGTTAVSVERVESGLAYEITVEPTADTDRLWVVVGGAEIAAAEGFERVEDDGRTRLRLTGEEPGRLRLLVDVNTASGSATDGGREVVATDRFTFATVPFVEVQRATDGNVTQSWPLMDRASGPVTEAGVFGDRYGLAGPVDVVTRAVGGRRVRVVTPAGVETRADPQAVASALLNAAVQLDVGDHDASVLAFGVPGVREGGESIPERDEFWVNADSRLRDADSVWLHEYVHTRQSFALDSEMRWFREASAEYYAARLAREQGAITDSEFRAHLSGGASNAVLTDPSTWDSRQVPYRKGARVLAALDGKIAAATDGERSLEAVFRRLNEQQGTVTYADFRAAVESVAGQSVARWADTHVAGSATVAAPRASGLLGFGLVTAEYRPTPLAFLAVTAGLSLVASPLLYLFLRRLQQREPVSTGAAAS